MWEDQEAKKLFQNVPRDASLILGLLISLALSIGFTAFLINQNQGFRDLKYIDLAPAYWASLIVSALIYLWPNPNEAKLINLLHSTHPDLGLIEAYQKKRIWIAPAMFCGALLLQMGLGQGEINSGRDVGRFAIGNAGMAGVTSIGILAGVAWWRVTSVLKQVRVSV